MEQASWRKLRAKAASLAIRCGARMRKPRSVTAMLALTLAVGGCTGVPLSPQAPAAFDLNGHWVLNEPLSDPPPNRRRLQAQADRGLLNAERPGRRSNAGMLAFVVEDFPVLSSRSMVIEQDQHSMGIRYENGAYRDVSWGVRKRGLWQVSAGWLEGELVISSKAPDATARESMRLSGNGRRMTVSVQVKSGGDNLNAVRTFDRVSPRQPAAGDVERNL